MNIRNIKELLRKMEGRFAALLIPIRASIRRIELDKDELILEIVNLS